MEEVNRFAKIHVQQDRFSRNIRNGEENIEKIDPTQEIRTNRKNASGAGRIGRGREEIKRYYDRVTRISWGRGQESLMTTDQPSGLKLGARYDCPRFDR
jgi:hypothetical protein